MIQPNTWVRIQAIVLTPSERLASLPFETRKTPLLMWLTGELMTAAEIGDMVQIRTVTGRIVSGKLLEANPTFHHDFGNDVPELRAIRKLISEAMSKAGEDNE
jgi:2-amino-4-ketopentanoate thiolase alpha subunit